MKLDIGCGKNKKEGFIGVDQYAMEGVDWVCDLAGKEWIVKSEIDGLEHIDGDATNPIWSRIPDNSVEEIHASHFLEHLEQEERVHFMNEAFRVLKPGGKATVITPHWASNRAYGDVTHKWPAVSEMFFYYLKQEWRDTQAPHTDKKWNEKGFSCDFDATWGYSFTPELGMRNQDYVQFALANFKEAAQDMHATLIKPVPKEE